MSDKRVFYSVVVGNLGYVTNDCEDYDEAKKDFDDYVFISKKDTHHRAYQEQVSLWKSDEDDPIETYEPPVTYRVLVGELGIVVRECTDYDVAKKDYDHYIEESKQNTHARGYQERVELWSSENEDPVDWYEPETDDDIFTLEDKEEIKAVSSTLGKYCFGCQCSRVEYESYRQPKTQEQLLQALQRCHDVLGVDYELFTLKYDDLYSDNWCKLLGKVCDECHAPLGYWHVCRFCDAVEFPGDDPHTCYEFTQAGHDLPDDAEPWQKEAHELYEAVMDGFEDSWQEDGFTEDVL